MRCMRMAPGRRFDLELDPGEDLIQALRELADQEHIDTAVITAGLGGFGRFTLGAPARVGVTVFSSSRPSRE